MIVCASHRNTMWGLVDRNINNFLETRHQKVEMGFRKFLRDRAKELQRFWSNQSKLNLNDEDVPVNNSSWMTKQWDDGTGKLNKNQHKLGGKDNLKLGYRYKKLD